MLDDEPAAPTSVATTPARRPRAPWIVVLVVLAVIAGLFVLADGDDAAAPPATTTTEPDPETTNTPGLSRRALEDAPITDLPVAAGPLLAEPTGTVLVIPRVRSVVMIDVDTGKAEEHLLEALPGGRPDQAIALGTGVVLLGTGSAMGVTPFSGVPPVDLGPAGHAVPSATPGRVWLGVVTSDQTTVREVALDGTVTQPPTTLPPSVWLLAGVEGGVLVDALGTLAVVDPATGAARTLISGLFVATNGTTVAALSCRDGLACGLRLVDVRTGEVRDVEPVPGTRGYGSFSPLRHAGPSATTLLTSVQGSESTTGLGPSLAAVDLATATGRAVFVGDVGRPFAVDPSGRWMFATGRNGLQGGPIGTPLVPVELDLAVRRNGILTVLARG